MALRPLDPDATDSEPRATIEIDGEEYVNVKEYSYESNIAQLGDPFRVVLGAPDGNYGTLIDPGSSVKFHMYDPRVAGGAKVTKLRGVVTATDLNVDNQSGSTFAVQGADLGWHLSNNSAPLWFRFDRGCTWERLLNATIYPHRTFKGVSDPGWDFQGVEFGNDDNVKRKVNNGRAGVNQRLTRVLGNPKSILPPIQAEPGMTLGDVLIHYAKLDKYLVNVSSAGKLQIFRPSYDTPSLYAFRHYASTNSNRTKNNVKAARLNRTIDGTFSAIECLTTITMPPKAQNVDDPNRGKIRGQYTNTDAPFRRYLTFVDTEQLTKAQAEARAAWMARRRQFDAYTVTYTVRGHSQGGNFYEPDTMCDVDDEVLGIHGRHYVSAVRYSRRMQTGTETTLTLRLPDLLAA